MKQIVLLLVVLAYLTACTTTVNLTLKNPTDIAQSARALVQSAKGIEKKTITLGQIQAKGDLKKTFTAGHSDNVVIKSSTEQGYDAWNSDPYTIPSKPDPYPLEVALGFRGQILPNDSEAVKKIGNALSDMGRNVGFTPISVKDGLSSWFGALVALIPPSKDQTEKVLYHIQPLRFTKKTITYDEFQYPSTVSSNTVQITGKSSANIAANVPLFGSAGVDINSENLYELRWSMNGFGAVTRKDPADWSLIKAITSLSDSEKEMLYKALNKDKNAVLLFVNRFYVIKNADFFVKEGKKLSTGAKLTASTFLTFNGAWSFDSVAEAHQQFQDLVLNIAGITVPATILKVKNTTTYKSLAPEKPRYKIVPDAAKPQQEMFLSGKELELVNTDTKKQGPYANAIKDLTAADWLDKGNVFHQSKNYRGAIDAYTNAIKVNPQFVEAYFDRGNAYYNLGNNQQAIKDYDKAIELNPQFAEAYYNRACVYSIEKNVQKSCESLQKAIDKGFNRSEHMEHMKKDSDLDNIRDAECYKKIMQGK